MYYYCNNNDLNINTISASIIIIMPTDSVILLQRLRSAPIHSAVSPPGRRRAAKAISGAWRLNPQQRAQWKVAKAMHARAEGGTRQVLFTHKDTAPTRIPGQAHTHTLRGNVRERHKEAFL